MDPEELERHSETLALLNDELTGLLDRVSASLTKIDDKAALVVGYSIAAASFLATRHGQPLAAGFAFGFFGVSAVFAVAVLAVRSYQDFEPRPLLNHYAQQTRAVTLAALTAERVQAAEFNRGQA